MNTFFFLRSNIYYYYSITQNNIKMQDIKLIKEDNRGCCIMSLKSKYNAYHSGPVKVSVEVACGLGHINNCVCRVLVQKAYSFI